MKITNIDFVGNRKKFFTISSVLIAIAIIATFIFGVEVAIEFKGGTLINYLYEGSIDSTGFATKTEEILGQKVIITEGTDFATSKNTIQISLVSTDGLTADRQFELTSALQDEYTINNLELNLSSDVSPSSGREFFEKCLIAVLFASILLIIYIAWRFKRMSGLSAGVMAIAALLHDVLMIYGTFVVFRIPIDANFMAVVLTILGYSINDTIVIYDRIRENKHLHGKRLNLRELVNLSINQSLSRSIHTSVSTIASMVIVSIVAIVLNVPSILSFSFPLIIGMISGVYSTICFAGPLWVLWEEHKEKKNASKAKGKAKSADAR